MTEKEIQIIKEAALTRQAQHSKLVMTYYMYDYAISVWAKGYGLC